MQRIERNTVLLIILLYISTGYGQIPKWDWIEKSGWKGEDEALSVTADYAGNIIVAGYFNDSITFGAITLVSSGLSDFFLTKYDSTGIMLWTLKGGGTLNDQITGVTTDPMGNIIITGAFQSPTLTIGTSNLTNTGSWDTFVAKFDTQGNVQWARKIVGPDHDNANCVFADAVNIVIGGTFKQNIIVGNDTLINASAGTYAFDAFLVKYDTAGNVVWTKSAGGTGEDVVNSVALDSAGNVYATGHYGNSSISFDTITLTNSGGNDVFVVKLSGAGNTVWARKAAGTFADESCALVLDQNNNLIISGYFGSSKIYFDTDSLVNINGPNFDAFLVKYDNMGSVVWVRRIGSTSMDVAYSLGTNKYGIMVAGNFKNLPFYFASDTLSNRGMWDIFLAKYDHLGNEIWAKEIGGSDYDETHSNCLHVAPNGRIIIAGGFASDSLYFDSIPLANSIAGTALSPTRDMFVGVLLPDTTGGSLMIKEVIVNPVILYPNPTESTFYVESSFSDGKINILTLAGDLVLSKDMSGARTVPVTLRAKGVYVIQILTNKQIVTKKVIVCHDGE